MPYSKLPEWDCIFWWMCSLILNNFIMLVILYCQIFCAKIKLCTQRSTPWHVYLLLSWPLCYHHPRQFYLTILLLFHVSVDMCQRRGRRATVYLQDVGLAAGKPDHLTSVSQYHRLVVELNQWGSKVQEQGWIKTSHLPQIGKECTWGKEETKNP